MTAGEFESAFRTYYSPLCSFAAVYVGSRAAAEELVQDVFLALWEQRDALDIRTSLRAYLYAAARNRALNARKRERLERAHREREGVRNDPVDPTMLPDAALEAGEIAARVREAITTLPNGCRRVVELRWQHQLPYAEIAQILGISVKGVEIQLTRAKRALRAVLTDLDR